MFHGNLYYFKVSCSIPNFMSACSMEAVLHCEAVQSILIPGRTKTEASKVQNNTATGKNGSSRNCIISATRPDFRVIIPHKHHTHPHLLP